MTPIQRFSLNELPALHPLHAFGRSLLCDGQPTGQILRGDELSHQFSWGDFFLVVSNYDWFDGVDTWFHLIDTDGLIRDIVSTPSYFGFMQDIVFETSKSMRFGFMGSQDRWTLLLRPAPRRSFTWRELRRRPVGFWLRKHFLSLHRAS